MFLPVASGASGAECLASLKKSLWASLIQCPNAGRKRGQSLCGRCLYRRPSAFWILLGLFLPSPSQGKSLGLPDELLHPSHFVFLIDASGSTIRPSWKRESYHRLLTQDLETMLLTGTITAAMPPFESTRDYVSVYQFGSVEHTTHNPTELRAFDPSRDEIHPIRIGAQSVTRDDLNHWLWPTHSYEYTFWFSLARRLFIEHLPLLDQRSINHTFLIAVTDSRANADTPSEEVQTLKKYVNGGRLTGALSAIASAESHYSFVPLPVARAGPISSGGFVMEAYEILPSSWTSAVRRFAEERVSARVTRGEGRDGADNGLNGSTNVYYPEGLNLTRVEVSSDLLSCTTNWMQGKATLTFACQRPLGITAARAREAHLVLSESFQSSDPRLGVRTAVCEHPLLLVESSVHMASADGLKRRFRFCLVAVALILVTVFLMQTRSGKSSNVEVTAARLAAAKVERSPRSGKPVIEAVTFHRPRRSRFDLENADDLIEPAKLQSEEIKRRLQHELWATDFSGGIAGGGSNLGRHGDASHESGWPESLADLSREQLEILDQVAHRGRMAHSESRAAVLAALLDAGFIEGNSTETGDISYRLTEKAKRNSGIISEGPIRRSPQENKKGTREAQIHPPAASFAYGAYLRVERFGLLIGRYRNFAALVLMTATQLLAIYLQTGRGGEGLAYGLNRSLEAKASLTRSSSTLFGDYMALIDMRMQSRKLHDENDHFRLENIHLRQLFEASEQAEGMMKFQASIKVRTLLAPVSGYGQAPGKDIIYIDRGAESGLRKGMGVITNYGVVGKVIAVGPRYAQVLSITSDSFGVGVQSEGTRFRGVLYCAGRCEVQFVPNQEQVNVGDRFVTSGFDRIFPQGLPIGQAIESVDGKEMRKIRLHLVRSYKDFTSLLVVLEDADPLGP